ncbi:MAG: YicC/YloC family endoribonuclease [Planctomycetota bacterium]
MIRSMTGFGSASTQVNGAHYVVEVRALNNKYFKSQSRLPDELQGLEAELDGMLARRLNRGTVVLTVRLTDMSADAAAPINTEALQRYVEQLWTVRGIGEDGIVRIDLADLMQLPGVMVSETGTERLEEARGVLKDLVAEACDRLVAMRIREGQTLHDDLTKHCEQIGEHLGVVFARVPQIVELYQDRLRQRMESLFAEAGLSVRDEDLVREVAIFAEKSDVAEEISRLKGHLAQFREIIDNDDEEPSGRTLDFLSQEMLREANTIGSKSLDVDIARHIVEIKGAIDRIKEQVQNVE